MFPDDSDLGRTSGPPTFTTTLVPTRVNSPSDLAFAEGDTAGGGLSLTPSLLAPSFTALNSVLNGIHPKPSQNTGGEGAVTGEEVGFNVVIKSALTVPAGHYFLVPQVKLSTGDLYWLSAPKPIVSPGTSFPAGSTDLQAWDPDPGPRAGLAARGHRHHRRDDHLQRDLLGRRHDLHADLALAGNRAAPNRRSPVLCDVLGVGRDRS